MRKYDFPFAMKLIESTFENSRPSGEADIDAALRFEEEAREDLRL
jgi:hypothetical protein